MSGCVCGSGRIEADCCARLHAGEPAATPEALMRSRYSAYVLGLTDYLLATWHPTTRPAALTRDEAGLKWLGLDVRRCAMQDADHGTVEFVARSKVAGRAHRLHETSRFMRENGRWFYLDGDFAA
ncbi:MAG: YchJ family metal-binding protein [Pseudomonadota bacterium]